MLPWQLTENKLSIKVTETKLKLKYITDNTLF